MSEPNLREAIVQAARELLHAASERDPALEGAAIMAIGWATVELDRAERELGVWLGFGEGGLRAWSPATRDPQLGAAARLGPALDDGLRFVILEPDTEGRLAATLARHGEGVAAVYLRTSAGVDMVVVPPLTSGPDGRRPTVLGGHPPSAIE